MFALRRYARRPSPSMVVALIALFVASGGVAYAAIPDSDGVIHGCYLNRTGALRVIDTEAIPPEECNSTKETSLTWNQQGIAGATGATGAQGPEGPKGDDGVDGVSALDAVPSGETIFGTVGADFHVGEGDGGGDWGIVVGLPMRAANNLGDNEIYVSVDGWLGDADQDQPETIDTNDDCDGSPANPTAPAGVVCIYVAGGDNAIDLNGWSVLPGTGESPYGFKLGWTAPNEGDTFIDAVWAYRAP